MSWESTRTYYNHLNTIVRDQMGGLHSARVMLNSVNFAPLEEMMRCGDWTQVETTLISEAERLEAAGAEGLLLCTNTMHKVAPQLEAAIGIGFSTLLIALVHHFRRRVCASSACSGRALP